MINIAAVFVVQKVIAIQIGPSGVALFSQYQNFLGLTTSIATGGIDSGIVKYVAEYRQDTERSSGLISNALRLSLICTAIMVTGLAIFAEPVSNYLFKTDAYSSIVRLFAATVTLFSLNALLVAILNGFGEVRKFAGSAIARSVVAMVLTVVLCLVWNLTGALIALTISQSLVFVVTVIFVHRSPWFRPHFFAKPFSPIFTRQLVAFSLMSLAAGILVPSVQILVRNHIMAVLSVAEAGYWDAMLKVSQGYLGVITGTLGVYYLPRLSSLQSVPAVRQEIWNGYRIIVPALLVAFPAVYFVREPIVNLLYSDKFAPTCSLFLPVLVGDFLMVVSWLLAYLMLAKAKTVLFLMTQTAFSAITYSLSVLMINAWGLQGLGWAHAIKYLLYTIVMAYLFRDYWARNHVCR